MSLERHRILGTNTNPIEKAYNKCILQTGALSVYIYCCIRYYLASKLGLKGVISSPGREIRHVGCGAVIEDAAPILNVQ